MKEKYSIAGNRGEKIRSDCEVRFAHSNNSGKNIVSLESKVASMYGKSIMDLTHKILTFFDIKGAKIEIFDTGALPFVIAARLEAAIKIHHETDKEFLPKLLKTNTYPSERKRLRFSRLYLPGNTPSMMLNAGLHSPDGIILDLEDSVAPTKKNEARLLVRNALRALNFYGIERMVRINQGDMGIDDLKYIVPNNVHLILVPKCESGEYIKKLDKEILKIKDSKLIETEIFLMPIIESALGVENSSEIAHSSNNVVAMAIGLEDYTTDIGVQRTVEGAESLYARMKIVNVSKAAGIQAIDSVFSDISDMEALKDTALKSKAMGFEGMGCIHPRQINAIKEAFAPTTEEIEKATKIVSAFKDAEKHGIGVVVIGSKMIDAPVVNRAINTLKLAKELGLCSAGERLTIF